MRARRLQRGLTVTGFILVAALVVAVLMLAGRITPAVIEYYSIRSALAEALADVRDPSSIAELRRAFQRRMDAGYIESVKATDIDLTKEGNSFTASIAWSRSLHLVANATLVLDFEATATR